MLAIVCLLNAIIFIYFKSKMTRMEQKVDLMFQLIQEYEQQKQQPSYAYSQPVVMQGGHNDVEQSTEILINVSDDDNVSEGVSSDSEEVSDEEENCEEAGANTETIYITNEPLTDNNIKTINLTGAEIECLQIAPDNDLDEISDFDDDAASTTLDNTSDTAPLCEINADNLYAVSSKTTKEISLDDNVSVISQLNAVKETPFKNYSVKELKNLCEEKGYANYKGLRKGKLIELLET